MTRILDERAVVVTGAGKGLGRAFAEHAAAAGARVVVNDVDVESAGMVVKAIRESGGVAVVDRHDVSTVATARALVDTCLDAFGALDGLVNNAGVFYQAPLPDADPQRMTRLIEINVLGTMYCTSAAIPAMTGSGGVVVNAGSLAATGYPRAVAYSTSKGAITSFSQAAALDCEALDIRVNCIWPAAHTPMVDQMLAGAPTIQAQEPAQRRTDRSVPSDVAPLVTYLLSPLSAGVTGQTFHFDGRALGVVVHTPLPDTPTETRDGWDVDAIAAALDGPLGTHLQPYGPRGAVLPPRSREEKR